MPPQPGPRRGPRRQHGAVGAPGLGAVALPACASCDLVAFPSKGQGGDPMYGPAVRCDDDARRNVRCRTRRRKEASGSRGWRDGRDRQGSERATRWARPECVCRGGLGRIEDVIATNKMSPTRSTAFYLLACLISSLTRSSETRRHTRCQSFLVMCVAASQSFKHCASHSAPRLRISSGELASVAWGVAACTDGGGLFRSRRRLQGWRARSPPLVTSSQSARPRARHRPRRTPRSARASRSTAVHASGHPWLAPASTRSLHKCRDQYGKLPKFAAEVWVSPSFERYLPRQRRPEALIALGNSAQLGR